MDEYIKFWLVKMALECAPVAALFFVIALWGCLSMVRGFVRGWRKTNKNGVNI